MRNHNHSFLRFVVDIVQIVILFTLLLAPALLVTTLKIKDLNLKASVIKSVAGVETSR